MSNHSVIEHRANYHYVKMEEDYILLCSTGKQYPHCKALILSVLEHWTNDKLAKGQDVYVYMTYPLWIEALYGLFRRNTIISSLAELEKDKFILKRSCRLHGKDTFEYALNIPELQERLKELPERTEKFTRPNLNAFKFKRVQKQTADEGLPIQIQTGNAFKSKRNIDTITEIPNIDTKESVTLTQTAQPTNASSDAAPPLFSSSQQNAIPQVTPPPQEEKPKRTRKPKGTLDDLTQKRVDAVVMALSGLKQEVMDDSTVTYNPSQKDIDAIVTVLLPQNPTSAKVRKVFLSMWNDQNRDGTYFWRTRMKIHNICSEYETRLMGIDGKTPAPPPSSSSDNQPKKNIVRASQAMRDMYKRDRELAEQKRAMN